MKNTRPSAVIAGFAFLIAVPLAAWTGKTAHATDADVDQLKTDLQQASREYVRLGLSIKERERTSVNGIGVSNLYRYQYFDSAKTQKMMVMGQVQCQDLLAPGSDFASSGFYDHATVVDADTYCRRACGTDRQSEKCSKTTAMIGKYNTEVYRATCGEIWSTSFPARDVVKKSFDGATKICSKAASTKPCWSFSGEKGQWGADQKCRAAHTDLAAAAKKLSEAKKSYDAAVAAAKAQPAPAPAQAPAPGDPGSAPAD